jgi:cytochrome P450
MKIYLTDPLLIK